LLAGGGPAKGNDVTDDERLLAESRDVYLQEAQDMLRQFEQSLLALEEQPSDVETLNAAFRAAHTIKGSSGLFGYHAIVHFTHGVEAVMDAMRDGEIEASEAVIALLLRAGDQIGSMLDEIAGGAGDATAADAALTAEICAMVADRAGPIQAAAGPAAAARPGAAEGATATEGVWHISLRFGPDALRNGFDPLSFLRYLPRVGEVQGIATLLDRVGPLEELDAESCFLGFEVRLCTPADRATIESVFEFAMGDCTLHLIPPGARVDEYLSLLQADPAAGEENRRLGEVLVAVGALTPGEVERLLERQRTMRERGESAPPIGELAQQEAKAAPEVVQAAVERQTKVRDKRADDARYIRVPADKLDHLIDLIGELVIAASGARMIAAQEGSARFAEAAEQIDTLVEAARDGALQLRMVQIGETFARFHRVVRDNAKKLGKEIELVITGGDTELDKSMVEMIADPLMHLVRNSIDHGLETPLERDAANKGPRGRLALNAYHDSGSIVIEVSDDGHGLDRQRILAKAIERGLVAPGEILSDEATDQLIFAPGFSTAAAVTDISGRGVGMDVVKRNIEALRGTVQLASTPGRGTTTQIRLPLTLAIIDGFLVGIGAVHYIIPLEAMVECVEPPRDRNVGRDAKTGYVDLRGEVLPFLDLRAFFGAGAPAPGVRQSTVVVRYGPAKVGLIVDRLLGEYQTVIKPLGKLLSGLRGIAGSTILGSGDVALILDVPALVAGATRPFGALPRHADAGPAKAAAPDCQANAT
jgi:two-component system chemotaxis sensor kinase CheA